LDKFVRGEKRTWGDRHDVNNDLGPTSFDKIEETSTRLAR